MYLHYLFYVLHTTMTFASYSPRSAKIEKERKRIPDVNGGFESSRDDASELYNLQVSTSKPPFLMATADQQQRVLRTPQQGVELSNFQGWSGDSGVTEERLKPDYLVKSPSKRSWARRVVDAVFGKPPPSKASTVDMNTAKLYTRPPSGSLIGQGNSATGNNGFPSEGLGLALAERRNASSDIGVNQVSSVSNIPHRWSARHSSRSRLKGDDSTRKIVSTRYSAVESARIQGTTGRTPSSLPLSTFDGKLNSQRIAADPSRLKKQTRKDSSNFLKGKFVSSDGNLTETMNPLKSMRTNKLRNQAAEARKTMQVRGKEN
ncbi:unnamed protein product [Didymodactylos carnosus]|uniref:Uncharacterized protein n=1 Tax=Didymodactylos carnosus TaxID=1234261 RepID=A0A8S2DYC5_9BILA|nr:unnamed protein product [Didymodactylos carnosus]CAF3768078.1 unnamed protein product [Didymodactylos carnosus]